MRIEVLVTTMHQTDMSKYREMNLQTDVVIANQTNCYSYQEKVIQHTTVRMISTKTNGLSRNRNIAMALASGDYILFADDDLCFVDGYEDIVTKVFTEHSEAEAIKFNLYDISEKRRISMKPIQKYERATILNMGASGVCGLVVKKDALIRANLKFNEQFGSGTENYCGEDTIFLYEMLKKGIKFFRSPEIIAGINQTESSWFEGYNEKYFIVSGKMFAVIYPKLAWLLAVRSAYRFSKNENCTLRFYRILKYYFQGIQSHD